MPDQAPTPTPTPVLRTADVLVAVAEVAVRHREEYAAALAAARRQEGGRDTLRALISAAGVVALRHEPEVVQELARAAPSGDRVHPGAGTFLSDDGDPAKSSASNADFVRQATAELAGSVLEEVRVTEGFCAVVFRGGATLLLESNRYGFRLAVGRMHGGPQG